MTGLIVHEWAERTGGAERVLDQLTLTFPDAELQLLWNDAPERYPGAAETWLSRTPLRRSKALALPLMPATWRFLDPASTPDWLLVSSHLFAHHARIKGRVQPPRYVYAHTPARYIWEPEYDERGRRISARAFSMLVKPLDKRRAHEATSVAANSAFTRARIARTWGVDAKVIYPPVDVTAISGTPDWSALLSAEERRILGGLPHDFLLGASRFVAYKKLDAVLRAGAATRNPVVLAGGGPDEGRLRACAEHLRVPTEFVINPSDELLRSLYQRARAYVFPAIEDFGIMPVEAIAAGTPVIVPSTGGAAETVAITGAGVVFSEDSPQGWIDAMDRVTTIDRTRISTSVAQFSSERFRSEVKDWVKPTVGREP